MNSLTENQRHLQPGSNSRRGVKRRTTQKMKALLDEEMKEGEEMSLTSNSLSDEDFSIEHAESPRLSLSSNFGGKDWSRQQEELI